MRGRGWAAVRGTISIIGLSGCQAAKPELPPASDGTSADDDDSAGPGDDGADVDDDGTPGTGGTTMPGASSGPTPADDTTGAPGMLVVDVSAVDFGDVDVGAEALAELQVTNVGDLPVSGIGAKPPGAPFAFQGGADAVYPGAEGDCGDVLDGGASCRITLALTPAIFGPSSSSITIDSDAGQITVPLVGRGLGATDNLLFNPGGEMGGSPPPGWSTEGGDWQAGASGQVLPHGGIGVIGSTEAWDPTTTSRQEVSIAELAALVDAGEMRMQLQGWLRAPNPNSAGGAVDLVASSVRGVDQTWALEPDDTLQWTSFAFEGDVPPGTASIVVELRCVRLGGGESCAVYFDDVSLVLEYAPNL